MDIVVILDIMDILECCGYPRMLWISWNVVDIIMPYLEMDIVVILDIMDIWIS